MELGGRVLDQLRGHPAAPLGSDEPGSDGFSIQPELLPKVVEEERTSNTYPDPGRRKTPAYLPQRMVETRKAGRRRPPFYLDEEEEDAFEEFEDMVKNAPPEVRRQALEALERGESTAEILVRILLAHVAPGAPYGAHAKKPPKLPPPGQGSLF
jgi:hypothetical protein